MDDSIKNNVLSVKASAMEFVNWLGNYFEEEKHYQEWDFVGNEEYPDILFYEFGFEPTTKDAHNWKCELKGSYKKGNSSRKDWRIIILVEEVKNGLLNLTLNYDEIAKSISSKLLLESTKKFKVGKNISNISLQEQELAEERKLNIEFDLLDASLETHLRNLVSTRGIHYKRVETTEAIRTYFIPNNLFYIIQIRKLPGNLVLFSVKEPEEDYLDRLSPTEIALQWREDRQRHNLSVGVKVDFGELTEKEIRAAQIAKEQKLETLAVYSKLMEELLQLLDKDGIFATNDLEKTDNGYLSEQAIANNEAGMVANIGEKTYHKASPAAGTTLGNFSSKEQAAEAARNLLQWAEQSSIPEGMQASLHGGKQETPDNKIHPNTRIAPISKGHWDKWATVYKKIKPLRETYGMQPERLLESLKTDKKRGSYQGPIYQIETLRKIIHAGDNGELETYQKLR